MAIIATLAPTHPRRIGLVLLQVGMTAMMPCLCLGMATMQISFVVALAGALLALLPLHRLPGFWWGVAFAGWQLLSAGIGSVADHHRFPRGLGSAYVWLSLYLAQAAFAHPTTRRIGMRLLMVTAGASALLACAQFLVGEGGPSFWKIDPAGERLSISVGFAAVHLTQGFIMCLVFLVFLDARIIAGPQVRVHVWIARGYALLAMIISGARLAYVALPFGLAMRVVAVGGRPALLRAAATLGGALLLGIGLMTVLAPERLRHMVNGTDGRVAIWRVSTAMAAEHPWFGRGGSEAFHLAYNDAFARVLPGQANEFALKGGAPHAHSSLLSLAADFGVPAMLLYLLFLASVVRGMAPASAHHPRAWSLALAIIITSLVAGLFEDLVGHSPNGFATDVLLGLALSLLPAAMGPQDGPTLPGTQRA
jgi:O-antigen ligase